jgi:hypothetical protein
MAQPRHAALRKQLDANYIAFNTHTFRRSFLGIIYTQAVWFVMQRSHTGFCPLHLVF